MDDRDVYDPEGWREKIHCSTPEREALARITGLGLADTFRLFEQEEKSWSWWDYRSGAWNRDSGWRIDHIYLSSDLQELARSCSIDKEERGREQPSDHAPVVVDLAWDFDEDDEDPEND